MKNRIVILMGSPRLDGNTALLAEACATGAREAGAEVEIIRAAELVIHPCLGCNRCFAREDKSCFRQDDMQKVYASLGQADVLVLASPVFFYGISAQLKTLIDRLHAPIRDSFPIRKAALLMAGAASLPELFDAAKTEYRLALNFFHLEDAGMVLVQKVKAPGDVRNTPALEQAAQLGRSLA